MSKLQVVRREERNAVQSFLDVRNFFLVRANLQLKLYATEQKERPTMDLSQITNTDHMSTEREIPINNNKTRNKDPFQKQMTPLMLHNKSNYWLSQRLIPWHRYHPVSQ